MGAAARPDRQLGPTSVPIALGAAAALPLERAAALHDVTALVCAGEVTVMSCQPTLALAQQELAERNCLRLLMCSSAGLGHSKLADRVRASLGWQACEDHR